MADPPRTPLIGRPTPFERLARLGSGLGHASLWVKRDDAMALGIGGNKVRSLEYWIGEARAQGADTLVVAGQVVSNQCRLTAAVAAKLGLGCVILHNGARPDRAAGNLLLSRIFGAEIRFLGPVDEAARGRAAEAEVARLARAGRQPYLVGEPVTGALGYAAAAGELLDQARAAGVELAHIIVPGSMGPTEAGLLDGLARQGFDGRVHVISVEYPADRLAGLVEGILAGLADRLGRPPAPPGALARYDDGFLAPGYGKVGPGARAAMRRLAAEEALLLEPTYTAKPFAALIAMVEDGTIGPDEPACTLHTGGLPTLFEGPG